MHGFEDVVVVVEWFAHAHEDEVAEGWAVGEVLGEEAFDMVDLGEDFAGAEVS